MKTRVGPDVVRTEPAELDLPRHLALQEPQHPSYHHVAEDLHDIAAPRDLTDHQPRHALADGIVEGRKVPAGDHRQHLLRWQVQEPRL
jgi:hypothetical protein